MFESPVLSQIVPAVVLLLPAVMAEPAHQGGGKGLCLQCRNPEPFVLGRLGFQLASAVIVLCELFFWPYHPHPPRGIGGGRGILCIPELGLVSVCNPPVRGRWNRRGAGG